MLSHPLQSIVARCIQLQLHWFTTTEELCGEENSSRFKVHRRQTAKIGVPTTTATPPPPYHTTNNFYLVSGTVEG